LPWVALAVKFVSLRNKTGTAIPWAILFGNGSLSFAEFAILVYMLSRQLGPAGESQLLVEKASHA
jgi:hypothetical protein